MLLTVIAVATLLVAVVGATFAYFSLTVGGSATETAANVSAGKVATLEYTEATETATLSVTASDMAKPTEDTKYFATNDSSMKDSEAAGSVWLSEKESSHEENKSIKLGGVSLEGAGDETYSCTYTVTLSKEAEDTMTAALVGRTGEVVLTLEGGLSPATYDLSNFNTDSTKAFTSEFELSSGSASKEFTATLYLLNSATTDTQAVLAGKELKLKFTGAATCSLKSNAE